MVIGKENRLEGRKIGGKATITIRKVRVFFSTYWQCENIKDASNSRSLICSEILMKFQTKYSLSQDFVLCPNLEQI